MLVVAAAVGRGWRSPPASGRRRRGPLAGDLQTLKAKKTSRPPRWGSRLGTGRRPTCGRGRGRTAPRASRWARRTRPPGAEDQRAVGLDPLGGRAVEQHHAGAAVRRCRRRGTRACLDVGRPALAEFVAGRPADGVAHLPELLDEGVALVVLRQREEGRALLVGDQDVHLFATTCGTSPASLATAFRSLVEREAWAKTGKRAEWRNEPQNLQVARRGTARPRPAPRGRLKSLSVSTQADRPPPPNGRLTGSTRGSSSPPAPACRPSARRVRKLLPPLVLVDW